MLIIDNRREKYLLPILNEFISLSNEEDNISTNDINNDINNGRMYQ